MPQQVKAGQPEAPQLNVQEAAQDIAAQAHDHVVVFTVNNRFINYLI